jgi:hypothetical protein
VIPAGNITVNSMRGGSMTLRIRAETRGAAGLATLALLTVHAAWAAPRLQPVPDEPTQQQIRQQILSVFGPEFANAKGSAEKLSVLSGRLVEQAGQASDAAQQYTLLRMAVDAAVQAADVGAALQAIERLGKRFAVDRVALRLETLKGLARATRTPQLTTAIVDELELFADGRIAADDYPAALEAARLAVGEMRRVHDPVACKRAVTRLAFMETVAQSYQQLDETRKALDRRPDDPVANRSYGEFLCFVKGDWPHGLPMLGRGDRPEYRALATAELDAEKQRNLAGFLPVADAWWNLTEKEQGHRQTQIRLHALSCYRLAVGKLVGLDKARVERRLAAADETSAPRGAVKPGRPAASKVKILQALYGKPKRTVDVTAAIQSAVAKEPYLPVRVDMYLNGGVDPAPNQHKTLFLRYLEGRTVVERLLHEGTVETLPRMPTDGLAIREAAQPLTVVAARYGAGVVWLDVTQYVATLVQDPQVGFNFDPKKVADDQARKACRALVVWFDYQGRRYVRVFEHTRKCVLLPP